MERHLRDGETVVFEAQASGWPPLGPALVGHGSVLCVALCLTFAGGAITQEFGSLTVEIPFMVPALVFLGLVELYRVARWRSRTFVLTSERFMLLQGVFFFGVFHWIPRASGDSVALTEPATLLMGETEVALAGLDRVDAEALVHALQGADAVVPSRTEERRSAVVPRALLVLVALAILLGVAAEGLRRLDAKRTAEFQTLSAQVDACVQSALPKARARLPKGRLNSGGSSSGSSNPGGYGSLGDSTRTEVVRRSIPPSSDLIVDLKVQTRRAWSLIPRKPVVYVVAGDAPENAVFLEAIRAELKSAGIPFTESRGSTDR